MQIIYMVGQCQYLPYDEIKFDNNFKLEEILNTSERFRYWLFY